MSETKMLQVPLPLDVFRALRQRAADTDSTLKDTVNDILLSNLNDPRFSQDRPTVEAPRAKRAKS